MAGIIRRRYLGGAGAVLGGLLAAACGEVEVRYVQGPAGPAGPAGPRGEQGATGQTGAAGAAGAAGQAQTFVQEKVVTVEKIVDTSQGILTSKNPVTISWTTFRAKSDWGPLMQNSFREKFPHITVDLRHLQDIKAPAEGQHGNYPKMWALVAAEDLGDVFAWDPSHWVFYNAIRREVVRPLDDFMATDKLDLTQWFEPFITYQRWEGKIWGLPSWGWTGQDGILYNESMLQEAGLEFPDVTSPDYSMQSLYELAVQANQFHQRNGGFGIRTTLPGAAGVTIMCRAFNSDNLTQDGTKFIVHSDEKAREGMRWVYDLSNRERAMAVDAEHATRPLPEGISFNGGKIAIQQAGSLSVFGAIRTVEADDSPLFSFKSALFPKRTDGKRPSQLRGGTWQVGEPKSGTKHPEEGYEFVKHLSSRFGSLTFNTVGRNGALVRPDIMDDPWFSDPRFRVFLENFNNSMLHVVPVNFRGADYEGAVSTSLRPWLRGEVGFENGLISAEEAVNIVLAKDPL